MTTATWWWAKDAVSITAAPVEPLDPPKIVNPGAQTYYPGEVISLRIDNVGGDAASWTADGLPNGLSITTEEADHCIISGTAQALTAPDVVNPGDQTWSREEPLTLVVNNTGGAALNWSTDGFPDPLQITSSTATTATIENVDVKSLVQLDTSLFDEYLKGLHGPIGSYQGHGPQCVANWDCLEAGNTGEECGIDVQNSMHYYDFGRSCMAAYYYEQAKGMSADSRWVDYAEADAQFWQLIMGNSTDGFTSAGNRYFTGGLTTIRNYDPVTYSWVDPYLLDLATGAPWVVRTNIDREHYCRERSYAVLLLLDYLYDKDISDPVWTGNYPRVRDMVIDFAYQWMDECKYWGYTDPLGYMGAPYVRNPGKLDGPTEVNLFEFSPFMGSLLLESLFRIYANDKTGDIDKPQLLERCGRLAMYLADNLEQVQGTAFYRWYDCTLTGNRCTFPCGDNYFGYVGYSEALILWFGWRLQSLGVAYALTGNRRFVEQGDSMWHKVWGSRQLFKYLDGTQGINQKLNTQLLRFSFDYLRYRGDWDFQTYFSETSGVAVPPPVPAATYRPEISAVSPQTGDFNVAFSLQLSAKWSPTAWSALDLPDGLTIDNAGLISGTPTQGAHRYSTVFARNADGVGEPITIEFTISGSPQPVDPGTIDQFEVDDYISFAIMNRGGLATSWTVVGDWLPPGLSVNAETGDKLFIDGTLTTGGVYSGDITATNASGSNTINFTVDVGGGPIVITDPGAQLAQVNQAYSLQLSATGLPTSWDATGLPTGLSIDNTGLISGTPTVQQFTTASVTATDERSTSDPVSIDYTIHGAATDAPILIDPGDQNVVEGVPYELKIRNIGGPVDFTNDGWNVRTNWLPEGLSVTTETEYHMTISGVPGYLNIAPISSVSTRPTGYFMDRPVNLAVSIGAQHDYNQYIPAPSYEFAFDEPQQISYLRFTLPPQDFVISADTTGDGSFDTVLTERVRGPETAFWYKSDWEWHSWSGTETVYAIQHLQKSIREFTISGQNGTPPQVGDTVYEWGGGTRLKQSGVVYEVGDSTVLVDVADGESDNWNSGDWLADSEVDPTNRWEYSDNDDANRHRWIYELQIYADPAVLSQETKDALQSITNPDYEVGVPVQAVGDVQVVPPPTSEQEYIKGMYIEVWMIDLAQWIQKSDPRPPLRDEPRYQSNLARLQAMSANMVWVMPVRSGFVDGEYTGDWYGSEVLWPSDYIASDSPENYMQEICDAFHADGIQVYAGDRPSSYTPESGVAPEDVIPGMAGEMAASGLDGVAVAFDEQGQVSDQRMDEWRRAADNVHAYPGVLTFANLYYGTSGTRQHSKYGDVVDTDLLGTNGYFTMEAEQWHYKGKMWGREYMGSNPNGRSINTQNVAWSVWPNPLYYATQPPVCIYGMPLSIAFAGIEANAYWRLELYNNDYTDRWVPVGYKMLDTLAAWGGKSAEVPEQILVIRSDSHATAFESRDYAYDYYGDYPDSNKIMHRNADQLEELLVREGLPFHVRYMMYPQHYPDYNNYDLIILASAYQSPWSDPVPAGVAAYLQNAADAGVNVLIMDRGDQTNISQWNYFDGYDTLSSPNISSYTDNITHSLTPELYSNLKAAINSRLSTPPVYLNRYHRDIELSRLDGTGLHAGSFYLLVINWETYATTADVGITVPAGNYTVLQRDRDEVRTALVNGSATWTAADLAKFRVDLVSMDARIFYITPQ